MQQSEADVKQGQSSGRPYETLTDDNELGPRHAKALSSRPRAGKGLKKARLRALERLRTELLPKLCTFLASIVGEPAGTPFVLPLDINREGELPGEGFVQPIRNESLTVALARPNFDELDYMRTRHLLPSHMAPTIPAQVQRTAVSLLGGETEAYYTANLRFTSWRSEDSAGATSEVYYFNHLSLPLNGGIRYKEL